MALSGKQKGVLRGMAVGALFAAVCLAVAIVYNPFHYQSSMPIQARMMVLSKSLLVMAVFLCVSVGQLARDRFFNPLDIDGSGLTQGSEQAKVLQAILQNTLEQGVLAIVVYIAWTILMPVVWLSAVPVAAILFFLGRVQFFAGYKKGAPGRALGFSLTFYPSVLMLLTCLLMLGYHSLAHWFS